MRDGGQSALADEIELTELTELTELGELTGLGGLTELTELTELTWLGGLAELTGLGVLSVLTELTLEKADSAVKLELMGNRTSPWSSWSEFDTSTPSVTPTVESGPTPPPADATPAPRPTIPRAPVTIHSVCLLMVPSFLLRA